MSDAYIYEAIRTPRGRATPDGNLHSVKPISLLTGLIDDLLLGCATPVGDQGANLARIAVLAAGWEQKTPGVQLNRFCGAGLEAVNLAAQKLRSGWDDLVLAAGVASMSRVPPGADGGAWMHDPETSLRTGYLPPGIAADLIATLDGYALRSHQKAAAARAEGRLRSLTPVRDQNGVLILDHDQAIKPITSKAAGARLGMLPRARILAGAVIGCDPATMLAGAAAASRKALAIAGLSINDIDLFEVHEPYAAVALRFLRDFDLAQDKFNVNGGAITAKRAPPPTNWNT